ncbi:phosphate acetyltransferase [Rhodosalinus sp.]|uniref:phosphate acetyltransferase n=1 Tax=Rhodosalinus sp. TaxID=2047741 RepID=UPI003562C123
MEPGASAQLTRTFTRDDAADLARLTGIVVRENVPEPLIGGLIACLLGTRLPGHGTNWLKQDLQFLEPVPLGTDLTARVEVTRVRPEKDLVDLWASVRMADGTLVCEGRALVRARGR